MKVKIRGSNEVVTVEYSAITVQRHNGSTANYKLDEIEFIPEKNSPEHKNEKMVAVKIDTLDVRNVNRLLDSTFVFGPSVGECLDKIASSPVDGAVFRVTVITTEARSV